MLAQQPRKGVHMALTAVVSAYLTFVFFIKRFTELLYEYAYGASIWRPVLYTGAAALFFAAASFGLSCMQKHFHHPFRHDPVRKQKLSAPLFISVALPVLILNLMYLASEYPGGYSYDTFLQWEQAHTMEISNHHPFFHTLLFILLSRIRDTYPFLLFVQIAAFACATGYLAATMRAWGFRLPLILLLCGWLALNLQTRILLLFFWKDTALSVFFLLFLSHLFNIFLSRGEWLHRRSHRIASAALLACITLVRHNAVLFTAPLLVMLLLFLPHSRRACMRLIALVLVLILGVRGPLQSLYHVTPAPSTYLETIGLPMTILCASYAEAPETMPEEAYAYMENFASREEIIRFYERGDFNSVKWHVDFSNEKIAQTPLADFAKLTLATVRENALLSLMSVLELTDLVWEPVNEHFRYHAVFRDFTPVYEPLDEGIRRFCSDVFAVIDRVFGHPAVQVLSTQIGVQLIVLLLAWYISAHRMRGWYALWLPAPVLCYAFGTMLLLSGADYRFFHFICLASWPLAVLMLSLPRDTKNETCKSAQSILY